MSLHVQTAEQTDVCEESTSDVESDDSPQRRHACDEGAVYTGNSFDFRNVFDFLSKQDLERAQRKKFSLGTWTALVFGCVVSSDGEVPWRLPTDAAASHGR